MDKVKGWGTITYKKRELHLEKQILAFSNPYLIPSMSI